LTKILNLLILKKEGNSVFLWKNPQNQYLPNKIKEREEKGGEIE